MVGAKQSIHLSSTQVWSLATQSPVLRGTIGTIPGYVGEVSESTFRNPADVMQDGVTTLKPVAPVVTPDPVPSDENLMRLVGAAAAGAIVGSFVAYRWIRRRFVVSFRSSD